MKKSKSRKGKTRGPHKPSATKRVNLKKTQAGVVGDNAEVAGDVHFDDRSLTQNAEKSQGAVQAERIDRINQTFVYPDGYKPGPDPASMRRAYLYRLFCNTGALSLEGIDPKAASCETDACLSLGAVYTALMTRSGEEHPKRGTRPEFFDRSGKSALEVLDEHPHVVLLGDPGSGKSTFVNFIAWCMAGELLERPEANLALLTRPVPKETGEDDKKPQTWRHKALLPVRVILRDFAARGLQSGNADARALWGFIKDDLESAQLGGFVQHLEKELREKGGFLLLDGLDEVPEAEQRRDKIKRIVQEFIKAFGSTRVVLTSRTYAYQKQDWRIPDLYETVLSPFTEGQIRWFIDRWYAHTAQLRGLNPDEARGRAELLKQAIYSNDRLGELAGRPILLTLMASLHSWRGGNLPENREQLYADTVDLLLDSWERPKIVKNPDGGAPVLIQPSLMEWLKIDRTQMRRTFNELAYNAHARQPELTGTADIDEGELVQALWDLSKNPGVNPSELMKFLRDRAGLILPRGVKVYSLPHRTFQEYLAACHLTDEEFPERMAELCRCDPDRWREVCLLAGAKASRGMSSAVWLLAEALCFREPDDAEAEASDMWGALLAGQLLSESAVLSKVSGPNRIKLDRIRRWLVLIMEGEQLPALERVNAGNALAVLGDPRFNPEKWYLPDDETLGFVEIPVGPFGMGSDKKRDRDAFDNEMPRHSIDLSGFSMAKFPVTVAQYRCFAEETEKALDSDWKRFNRFDNHPVVMVSWHEAVAYCEWLSQKTNDLGWNGEFRLPTEAQWEKAGRGSDGRIYPWGDEIDPNRTNYSETGIGNTSPVGCFTGGKSPFGVLDMAGNVWEWCEDLWHDNYENAPDDGSAWVDNAKVSSRVLRGGSWFIPAGSCRSACRNRYDPGARDDDNGFRLVFLPGQKQERTDQREGEKHNAG